MTNETRRGCLPEGDRADARGGDLRANQLGPSATPLGVEPERPLAERTGPLLAAAARFMGKRLADGEWTDGLGPIGLRQLLDRVESHVFESVEDTQGSGPLASPGSIDPEEAERRFVEGGGAWLALLLLDRVPDGHQVVHDGHHGLRLGHHGFFDPFAAMQGVLDADDPRRALAEAIRRGEAEGNGTGPISRAVGAFSRELELTLPDRSVVEQFGATVRLDDRTEVDLGRVLVAADGEGPEVLRAAVARMVRGLGTAAGHRPGAAGRSFAAERSRLLPRLLGPDFTAELRRRAEGGGELATAPLPMTGATGGTVGGAAEPNARGGPRSGPQATMGRRVVPGVEVGLIVAYGDRARYLTRAELDGQGVDLDVALAQAIANLAARSAKARFLQMETDDGPMIMARSGDGLDAARLLLPGLFDVLTPELGPIIAVGAPHRDTLIATVATEPALVKALMAQLADGAARAPHPISATPWRLTALGLSALPEAVTTTAD